MAEEETPTLEDEADDVAEETNEDTEEDTADEVADENTDNANAQDEADTGVDQPLDRVGVGKKNCRVFKLDGSAETLFSRSLIGWFFKKGFLMLGVHSTCRV